MSIIDAKVNLQRKILHSPFTITKMDAIENEEECLQVT